MADTTTSSVGRLWGWGTDERFTIMEMFIPTTGKWYVEISFGTVQLEVTAS